MKQMGKEHPMRAVITGASRGIGLEFARQLLQRGDSVEAAVRSPQRANGLRRLAGDFPRTLRIYSCDVAAEASVRAFAASLSSEPVDLLINNAGIGEARATLEELDLDNAVVAFQVNALGAIRVTRAVLAWLRRSSVRKAIHITSKMGSISENDSGDSYAYRMSKAALNMASRSMAIDLREDRIISAVIHPGWVRTDMGGTGAPTSVEDSVSGMIRVIDGLTMEQSGSFLDYRGQKIPW
jgi:NAD(P)-dependent dehydrogenase (short-subunit alcohol dehydrogenase family)